MANPSSVKDLLASAHDIEARFGCKGKTHWRGCKVATVQVGDTGFLAAADVLAANQHDGESLSLLVNELPQSALHIMERQKIDLKWLENKLG